MIHREKAISLILAFIRGKFPKTCNKCGYRYETLEQYYCETKHVGDPIIYEPGPGNWSLLPTSSTFALSNCSCGNTLSVSSSGMNIFTMWRLLRWVRKEAKLQRIGVREVLSQLRDDIKERIADRL